jgi:threonine dehydratase
VTRAAALAELEADAAFVHETLPPTPQIAWPLLAARAGCEVWLKHENHQPIGSFKARGALTYFRELRSRGSQPRGVIAATRGNHGQAVPWAARRFGTPATIVVPRANSVDKNAAMRALGATLIEHGRDFQEAFEHAQALAKSQDLHFVPSYHEWLVLGVSTCAFELLRAVPELDVLYVPIGLGSGICGALRAREALGARVRVVGVVTERAPTYALSFAAGRPVATESADTFADGLAVRVPNADALARIRAGVERIVQVSEAEVGGAMRALFSDTHNVAEGAGAAALAACLRERDAVAGKRVGVVLTGGNVDRDLYARVLAQKE